MNANDTNYQSHVDEQDVTITREEWVPPTDPLSFDDILKFSRCARMLILGLYLPGGREDCSDAVRGNRYTWLGCLFSPRGKGGLTVKGSIDGWTVDTCEFEKHGSEYDIEVGQFDNYWFPGRAPTRRGVISKVHAADGKPVKVRLWDAEKPEVEFSNVEIVRIPKAIWYPYFLFRYVVVRLQGKTTK